MESHGALVGWGHHSDGERLMLRVESMPSREAMEQRNPDVFRVRLSKQQAFLLGNYLIEQSGQTAVDKKERSWFRRLFG
ncbi:hypothetical protein G7A66_12165 [Altererythrobacter sp. SALINAS58]|uniref:hypothetical protein n=1 Tax=Alteripontixanthobacter muriae TaxID=2705546 RepID=UPI001577765C|nr:hypothetical protein [Alteripontixanthobacter muriae]NTZ43825.1 hypothetical protein [Alteripontixanthobacter muriae]